MHNVHHVSGLFRTKLVFQDFLGPGNFRKKSRTFHEMREAWVEERGGRSVMWWTSVFLTKSRHWILSICHSNHRSPIHCTSALLTLRKVVTATRSSQFETTADDRVLECVQWNGLFTTSAERGPMFVFFNILFRNFYQYSGKNLLHSNRFFKSKFYLQNAALLNSKKVNLEK